MNSKIKSFIREVEKKEPAKESLQEYLTESMLLQRQYVGIKMVLEYYMFYEMISEGINPYIESVEDVVSGLNQQIQKLFEESPDAEERKKIAKELLSMREEVIARMKVLTAYVDKFVIYEYAMNRVQYRFEDQEMVPGDETFAQDLLKVILSGKDSATINDNVRFAIGQLPVRMTRTKYYELIRNSISVYTGSEKSSLEGFLYMFRTKAMLYKDPNEEKYFTEFRKVVRELEELDFDQISHELYQIYAEKIAVCTGKLNDVSDLYMQLGQLINAMYTLCVTADYTGESMEDLLGANGIRGILALFFERDSDVFAKAGVSGASDEEKLDYIEETFGEIEGKQEKLFEVLESVETTLDHLMEGKQEYLKEYGVEDSFAELKKLFLLSSSSIFADLDQKTSDEKVTEEFAEQMAAELIADCKAFFKGKSRLLRRAIMASTLEQMPVFFRNAQEIADYVVASLAQCDDEAEKYAVKQLLMDMMVQN